MMKIKVLRYEMEYYMYNRKWSVVVVTKNGMRHQTTELYQDQHEAQYRTDTLNRNLDRWYWSLASHGNTNILIM